MAKRYLYKDIKIVQYWNSYRPYYGKMLLHVGMPTRKLAYEVGKLEVDYMNGKEN